MMVIGVLELLTVLHRTDDTVVVVFLATSLAPAKEQKKADQSNETTHGDANDGTSGQHSAV